jgi:hypothetical protein
MSGKNLKEISVVIMDGSNQEIVDYIAAAVFDLSDLSVRSVMIYELSENHPSTIVVRSKMTDECYVEMRNRIELRYPGLCMFNPPMMV